MPHDEDREFAETLRQAIALFDARDPERARFGASRHQYRLRAPLAPARLDAIEHEANVRFPDEYRAWATGLADGGAGPYYGLLPLDHPVQRALARGTFDPADPYRGGVIGLGHLGCGYLAVYVVDRAHDAFGQVWIDVRGGGGAFAPAYPTFRHYVTDWVTRLAHAEWLPSFVKGDTCALAGVLSQYLRSLEEQRGLAAGSLAGDALRDALDQIGDGMIALVHVGADPFFADADPLDPCVACARLAENLGLRKSTIAPGLDAIPAR